VVLPGVSIGKNCRITHAIIDKGAIIPDNTIIGEDHVEDAKRFHISEEGVVLVTPEMMGQNLTLDGTPIY
jgi:glucose-1-phosphate adenylyltransferase